MDVVTSDWVADRDDLRVVDVREEWEYEGIGHLPGAVNVPFETFRSDGAASEGAGEAGMLPGSEAFGDLLGEAGVARDDEIVAYDDTHGVFAARFLVTCELYGHPTERLHLLDGDYSSWMRSRETSGATSDVEPTTYEASFVEDGPLVDADSVAEAADDPDSVLVDTREADEFDAGHIPGAIRLDWIELVDQDTRGLKPEADLRGLLEDRGVTPDRRVVLYCNTARRISHTYVVLRHLGYEDLAFYEGSLTEWEAAGRPLQRAE
jgi:thiosulfate/3-mercaptopyruvate sulfurtransferase